MRIILAVGALLAELLTPVLVTNAHSVAALGEQMQQQGTMLSQDLRDQQDGRWNRLVKIMRSCARCRKPRNALDIYKEVVPQRAAASLDLFYRTIHYGRRWSEERGSLAECGNQLLSRRSLSA